MEISIGALDAGAEDHRSGVPPEEPEQDIAAKARYLSGRARHWAKFGVLVAMATAKPWAFEARSDKTRQRQRRAGPDHGPMACGRVSLRMKMSRPW